MVSAWIVVACHTAIAMWNDWRLRLLLDRIRAETSASESFLFRLLVSKELNFYKEEESVLIEIEGVALC